MTGQLGIRTAWVLALPFIRYMLLVAFLAGWRLAILYAIVVIILLLTSSDKGVE